MRSLLFGTAGIPLSTPRRDSISGVARVRELGLDAMELEFVQGVRMSAHTAREIRRVSGEKGIILTAHAPYFINLASPEEKKVEASIRRIVDTARVASEAGAWSVVFHAGFFQGRERSKVYDAVKRGIGSVMAILEDEGIDIWIRPETTGKQSQFSGLDDLIVISSEFDGVLPCVDFAHLHARTAGKCNTYDEFCSVFERIADGLGEGVLREMHMHLSGIEYTEKGERRHIPLESSDMRWRDLIDCMREKKVGGVLISESPIIEDDALRMKYYYLNEQI